MMSSGPARGSPWRSKLAGLALATVLTLGIEGAVIHAQAPHGAALRAAEGNANSKPGARTVPGRVIPVPSTVDPVTAALIAGPYSAYWNLSPPTDAAWRAMLNKAAAAALPNLAKMRAALGVTITPMTVGGVNAYILTPRTTPAAHLNQLVFQIHGGG